MLTPEKLTAAIAERQRKGGATGPTYKHPCVTFTAPPKPQLGISIFTDDAKTAVLPYVRFTGAIADGIALEVAFGEYLLSISRPQQPPDSSGDDSDKDGAELLAAILVGFQDQTLRGLRHDADQLEVKVRKLKKR
jgi:hypothetical protein